MEVVNAVHQPSPSRRRPSCRHCPSIARATALAATVLAAALAAAVHCARGIRCTAGAASHAHAPWPRRRACRSIDHWNINVGAWGEVLICT